MNTYSGKALAFFIILTLNSQAVGGADDHVTVTTVSFPSPTSPNRHLHKKKPSSHTDKGKSAETTREGASDGNIEIQKIPHDSDAGSVGSPNMESPDHTPGTTGTSGQ